MESPRKKQEQTGGGWIVTFADLMSLLMCFFVLLLSFSELDVMKFKAIAGSMKLAFGVQRDIKAIEMPMGTSVIAQEFSAGKPDPTVINEIRQKTQEEDKQTLEFSDVLVEATEGEDPEDPDGGKPEDFEKTAENAKELAEALQQEVEQGMIQIETQGASIVIRIREKGSFPSGTASFDPAFAPVIAKLRDSLTSMEGTIAVAGHTDDIPIKTPLYRSNWDLSSARAVSVVHALLDDSTLDAARFVVEGHGDAHPLVPNDTPANRAQNRRVEITIRQEPNDPAPVQETIAGFAPGPSPEVESRAEPPAPAQDAPGEAPPGAASEPLPDWVPRPPTIGAPPTMPQAGDDPRAEPAASASDAVPDAAAPRPPSRLDSIRNGFVR